MKITVAELSRYAECDEETIRDAISHGLQFKTLSDASDFQQDRSKVAQFKKFLKWKKDHP